MQFLVSRLEAGQRVDRWQLSETLEERFDVADEPMQGDMDAGFFLTDQRNYIPHEYPCRREFAARSRDRRPEPRTSFEAARWWFPFGADRVDLSGFWFRATRVETWARTYVRSETGGPARFRLVTCGAAMVLLNGTETGWLAPCKRNWEESLDLTLDLRPGENEVRVWFSDLCERDTRYFFSLTLLEGEGLETALPVPVQPETVREMECLLAGMWFSSPHYERGDVTVLFDHPARGNFDARIAVRGHFISHESFAFARRLTAGQDRLIVAPVSELPADFRYFDVTLRSGDMSISHAIGAEIVHPSAPKEPPADLTARAGEALDHVAQRGEPDTVRALARLATGRGGAETDAMIEACLPPIEECHDCSDFLLVPLIWSRLRWAGDLDPALTERVDAAILSYRFWMDEPGNDVMWFFSENHALLFHTACYLSGQLFPEADFVRSGRTGTEQKAVGAERLRAWFDHFETCEMAEWNSAPYFPVDLKGLCTLYALAPDADIRDRAANAIGRLLAIVAQCCHQGVLTASQGRSYEFTLRPGKTLELSAMARLLWGCGWYGRQVHALPQLALCIRDHGLVPDRSLADIAFWTHKEAREWAYCQGEGGFAPLYHYKTRHHAMGSVAAYKPGTWGYQETVLHARLGNRPESQVWINHPGEWVKSGFGRPSYWGGCGTLPRVHQYRALAVLQFDCADGTPDFTHAWVPEVYFDEVMRDGNDLLLRAGKALVLIRASAPLEHIEAGATAGCEVRLPGRQGIWLVRLSDTDREGDLSTFALRMETLSVDVGADGWMALTDPDYGRIDCAPDGAVNAEGRDLDPARWTHAGAVRLFD